MQFEQLELNPISDFGGWIRRKCLLIVLNSLFPLLESLVDSRKVEIGRPDLGSDFENLEIDVESLLQAVLFDVAARLGLEERSIVLRQNGTSLLDHGERLFALTCLGISTDQTEPKIGIRRIEKKFTPVDGR